VAGHRLADCSGAKPTSVPPIHVTADTRVRLDKSCGEGVAHITGLPISTVLDQWRKRDRCARFQTGFSGAVTTSIATCPADRSVEMILIAGAGHQWPGSDGSGAPGADTESSALDATTVIWGFFTQHRRNWPTARRGVSGPVRLWQGYGVPVPIQPGDPRCGFCSSVPVPSAPMSAVRWRWPVTR